MLWWSNATSAFWQVEVSRPWRLNFLQVLWTADQRFWQPFSGPHCSPLWLIEAMDSSNLVFPYMECFSAATNLFGFLRPSEVVVE